MKKSNSAKAISKIARENGISENEVRKEIAIAIDMAMADPDPIIHARWERISRDGRKPTPEEFIEYLSQKVQAEQEFERRSSMKIIH